MRCIGKTALLAVPLLLLLSSSQGRANGPEYRGFGAFDCTFRLFPHMHQHGPLFNYGPYYGYYPFKPYGPWDAYLRYDPFFYGDPYANFKPDAQSSRYGLNPHVHKPACISCGFLHASWLHGGWYRGHTWLFGHGSVLQKPACNSCGAVGEVKPTPPTGDVTARYSGFGTPAQSAVYYSTTLTLDPAREWIQTAGSTR
jgi:hypothetical protein